MLRSTSNYYTQAPNFVSSTSDNIDPRTRLFGFQHSLGTVTGNDGMGPELDFTLTYSPTTSDTPYLMGYGVLLAFTVYDHSAGTLYLSSGESYKVDVSTNPITIKQQKMVTFRFSDNGDKTYTVIERNGTQTILKDFAGMYVPSKLITPLGFTLALEWKETSTGFTVTVSDDSGTTLCTWTNTSSTYSTTLAFFPEGDESYTITLKTANNYLSTISNSALPEANWQFFYEDVGIGGSFRTLYKIITPTGLTKSVIYNRGTTTGLMFFPTNAGLAPLPAVTQYTLSPTPGQADTDIVYNYTPETTQGFSNYLGYNYPLGNQWNPNSDNMYGKLLDIADYKYQTVMTQTDTATGNDITTTYTYNNYHLLVSTVEVQGTTTHTTEVEYFAITDSEFEDQPLNFQYPKKQTVTWTDSSLPTDRQTRQEITTFQYDEYGNLTQHITPEGTQTDYLYYTGEEADSADKTTGCPAEPNGFVRFIKRKTVTPATTDPAYSDVPARTTFYRYLSLDTRAALPDSWAVLPVQDTHTQNDNDEVLVSHLLSYVDSDPTSLDYGRVQQHISTVFDITQTPAVSYAKTASYTYDHDNKSGTFTTTKTLVTDKTDTDSDTHSLTSQHVRSRFTHQLHSVTDSLQNKVAFEYDGLGRLSARTVNPNTDYEDKYTLTHTLTPGDDSTAAILLSTHTDNKGNGVQIYFDGMGRPVLQKHNAVDAGQPTTWYDTVAITYDALGRAASHVTSDYAQLGSAADPMTLTVIPEYDDWGQNIRTQYNTPDLKAFHLYEPISRQKTEQTQAGTLKLGSQVTEYYPNTVLGMVYTSAYHSDGSSYSQVKSSSDGLGRLRSQTDALGNVTTYTYDAFDRVSLQTLPDNTQIKTQYAPFSSDSLPVQIDVIFTDPETQQEVTLTAGKQTFDGLGRLTSTTCWGRTQHQTYARDADQVATTSTDSMSQALNFTFDPQLNNAILTMKGSSISQSFSYELNSGLMKSVSETGSVAHSYNYSESGALQGDDIVPDGQGHRTTAYKWSLMGLPVGYTDVGGKSQTLEYDAYGRPTTLKDDEVTVTLAYDEANRLLSQQVESLSTSDSLTITLTWDEFNRETQREIVTSAGDTVTLAQTWLANNQLATRTLSNGADTIREEKYEYDSRNRLTTYTCTCADSANYPQDGYGQPIAKQIFTLDALSNIVKCVTTLGDSSSSTDTATFTFDTTDRTQLTGVAHTLTPNYPASLTLTYDDNGRLTTLEEDGKSTTMDYDEMGRLIKVTTPAESSTYGYNGLDQLVLQNLNGSDARELYYQGSSLVNEIHTSQGTLTRFIPGGSGGAAVSDSDWSPLA